MQKLFDEVRGCWVAPQPEEIVRQKLLWLMIYELGFPKALLAVEKKVDTLPHIKAMHAKTNRRADIICFAKDIHPNYPLYPLLMVECKASALTKRVIQQVLGYNHLVQAPFVAIAGPKELQTYWFDAAKKEYKNIQGLPFFNDLLDTVSKKIDHAHLFQ